MSRRASKKESSPLMLLGAVVVWKDSRDEDTFTIGVTDDSSTVPQHVDDTVVFYLTKQEHRDCVRATSNGRHYDCGDFYIIRMEGN